MDENVMKTRLMIIHKIMKVNNGCCGRNMSPIVGRYTIGSSGKRRSGRSGRLSMSARRRASGMSGICWGWSRGYERSRMRKPRLC
jgi:hypothetical protein